MTTPQSNTEKERLKTECLDCGEQILLSETHNHQCCLKLKSQKKDRDSLIESIENLFQKEERLWHSQVYKIADFILSDRKATVSRVVEPLRKRRSIYMNTQGPLVISTSELVGDINATLTLADSYINPPNEVVK